MCLGALCMIYSRTIGVRKPTDYGNTCRHVAGIFHLNDTNHCFYYIVEWDHILNGGSRFRDASACTFRAYI